MPSYPQPDVDYPPFAALPVKMVTASDPRRKLAVSVSGRFTVDQPPLVCISGFTRNMTDFTDFIMHYRTIASVDWPIVLVDLAGRGRSTARARAQEYSTIADAHDLSAIARALGISKCIFVGQGHGGQVVMSLGAQHPNLIAGAVLINAGPTTEPRGLVRLRSNLGHMDSLKGEAQIRTITRQVLKSDYPGLSTEALDRLADRSHFIDKKGRARSLFDPALISFLDRFELDDEFEPQWSLFNTLTNVPLMLVRTHLSDRLGASTFSEMIRRHPNAVVENYVGEGSPALLNDEGEVSAIADFVMQLIHGPKKRGRVRRKR